MKARRTFSEDFKKTVIQRLLEPDSPGPSKIAEEFGIYDSTLYNWKQKYAKSLIMKKSNNSKNWSPEKMLEAIIQTSSMDEQELGEYLRSNGLHSSDLEAFKNEFIKAKKETKRGRPQLDPEVFKLRKEVKSLSSDLKRKDAALSEYAARVILLKKSHEIWGTNEDDE